MASIRKHRRSGNWIACYTKPDGNRTTMSTRIPIKAPTADERTMNRARALEIALKLDQAGLRAKNEKLSADDVRDIVNGIMRAAGAEEMKVITTRQFFKTWLAGKTNPATNARYGHTSELFLGQLNGLADQSMGKVNYQHVLDFMKLRRDDGAAPKTVRVDVKSLNNAFNLSRRLGHIQTNPVEQALALQPISVDSSTKDVFMPPQITLLVSTAEGDWKTTTLLGYYTAGRLRDCTNFKVRQIDWVKNVITIRQGKTGKPAYIPIHPCLGRHLRQVVLGLGPDDFVCPTLANRKSGGKSGLSREFSAIMRKAGIDPIMVAGKGKKKFSKLSFHSLRHSFNSHLANAGVDQETRQIMTGHDTKEANDDYTHIGLPKLAAAIALLPDVAPVPQESLDVV